MYFLHYFSLETEGLNKDGPLPLQCFPLYSILVAIGSPTVHYFRYNILKTRTNVFIDGNCNMITYDLES